MKTVKILKPFDGYPQAKEGESGEKRSFTKGEVVELSNAFADLIVGVGHAEFVAGEAEEPKPAAKAVEEKAPVADKGDASSTGAKKP